jgi:hypothetical protein
MDVYKIMDYPDIECPRLGVLRYSLANEWYEGQLEIQQSVVRIHFSMDENGSVSPAIERFTNLVGKLERYVLLAKEYAVENLLELRNESWFDENKEPLTSEQFKQRMVVVAITIAADGGVSFYFADDGLYAGHCLVEMDRDFNFVDADIPS